MTGLQKGILLFVLALSGFVLLFRLGELHMTLGDESHYALQAIEILENGNPIVLSYLGEPDLVYTKPPLVIWGQAICMALFGPEEWAVRLPSALAGWGLILFLILFCRRHSLPWFVGPLSGVFLLCMSGFVGPHLTQTADLDAMLSLWVSFYVLNWYSYIETGQKRYLRWTALGIALAVLTKGIAGLIMLPVLPLYGLIVSGKSHLLWNRRVLNFSFVAIIPVLGFYLLREMLAPGYLQAVWQNEVRGIFLGENEAVWHNEGVLFFIRGLLTDRLFPLIFLIPLVLPAYWLIKDQVAKRLLLLLAGAIGFYLLVISASQIKLYWYDAPLFPLIALFIGVSIVLLLEKYFSGRQVIFGGVGLLLVAGLWLVLQASIGERKPGYHEAYYAQPIEELKQLDQERDPKEAWTLMTRADIIYALDPLWFYAYYLKEKSGRKVEVKNSHELLLILHHSDKVMLIGDPKDLALQRFELRPIPGTEFFYEVGANTLPYY